MKQTAVEWFFEQLTEVDYGCINKTFLQNNNSLAGHKLRELFDQAKAMEKEYLYNFYMQGKVDIITVEEKNAEQYYNQTFKSE